LKAIEASARKGVLAPSADVKAKDECFADIMTMLATREVTKSDNIEIMWGNKATYNRFRVALDVQDAGNLLALAREFVKVVDTAMKEVKSTKATWDDPAVVLFVNKLESLCRSEQRFSAAYKACQEQVASAKPSVLDYTAKAAVMWAAMDDNQKTGVRVGMFPFERMKAAEAEGFTDNRTLCVALMHLAKKDGGMFA
jgi:hypothetical protein